MRWVNNGDNLGLIPSPPLQRQHGGAKHEVEASSTIGLHMFSVAQQDITHLADYRPVTIDELADVRILHETAFRALAANQHGAGEIDAFCALMQSNAYTDQIAGNDLWAAWIERTLIGTAGWAPVDGFGRSARIADVFVNPLFAGRGFGRVLAMAAEERARLAGFNAFGVRVTPNAVPFFASLGYRITAQGTRQLPGGIDLPVTYMRKQRRKRPPANGRGTDTPDQAR